MTRTPEHPPHPELIRVALMSDHADLRRLFERSGMVQIVDAVPDVLVWPLPHDADSLPPDLLAALADPAAPGVVAISERHPVRWFQEALRLGVDDVLCLPQTPLSLGMAAAKARAARARRSPAAGAAGPSGGHVFSVFSTKGGSGRTVIATNLAVSFAQSGVRTLLLDLDLHSGDDALVLGLAPRATVLDLMSGAEIDVARLAQSVTRHVSGADVLAAPGRPEEEELVAIDRLEHLLAAARGSYEAIVVDCASSFSPATLLALDHTDTLILVGAPDVPAVRSVRMALETIGLLELDLADVRIVMNRADAHVGLEADDIETAIRHEVAYTLPSDRAVPLSVNRGRPVVIDDPRSGAGRALDEIARSLLAHVNRRT